MQVENLSMSTKNLSISTMPIETIPNPLVQISSLSLELAPYIIPRIELFDKLKKQQLDKISSLQKKPIKISFLDGRVLDGESWLTTPYDVSRLVFGIKVAESFIVSKVFLSYLKYRLMEFFLI